MYSAMRQVGFSGALGDVSCAGVDVDTWKKANRIPLYRGINTWVVAYSGDPDETNDMLRDGMDEWMVGSGGSADMLSVVESYGEKLPKIPPNVVSKYPTSLSTPYNLSTKDFPIRYYKVSFRFNSQNEKQTTIAWPVYNDGTFTASSCPNEAHLGVFYVLQPEQLQTAEAVDKIVSDLNKGLNISASQASQASLVMPPATTTPWYATKWAIGLGVMVVGAGYFVYSGRKR